jgi:hypothetical protein
MGLNAIGGKDIESGVGGLLGVSPNILTKPV